MNSPSPNRARSETTRDRPPCPTRRASCARFELHRKGAVGRTDRTDRVRRARSFHLAGLSSLSLWSIVASARRRSDDAQARTTTSSREARGVRRRRRWALKRRRWRHHHRGRGSRRVLGRVLVLAVGRATFVGWAPVDVRFFFGRRRRAWRGTPRGGYRPSFATSRSSRASSARRGGSGSECGSSRGSEGAGAGAFARADRTVSVDRLLENLTRPTSSDAHAEEGGRPRGSPCRGRLPHRRSRPSRARTGPAPRPRGPSRRRCPRLRERREAPPPPRTIARRPRRRRPRSSAWKPKVTLPEAPSPPRARRVRGDARDRPARRGLPREDTG